MEIFKSLHVEDFLMPSTMMFGHSTKMMDLWTPYVEQIVLPSLCHPAHDVEIRVKPDIAQLPPSKNWKGKLSQALKSKIGKRKTLDLSGKFLLDMRFDTYKNFAHILLNAGTRILLARKILEEYFGEPVIIHVILGEKASQKGFHTEIYRLLNIPVIATDDDVYGNIVSVSYYRHAFKIRASLFDFVFPDYQQMPYDKIYIPRKGNRSIANNDEVEKLLVERGFKAVYFEDISVSEQWSLMRNAKFLVANHGAAVSNVSFNRVGCHPDAAPQSGIKVLELMSPGWIHSGFRAMTHSVNGTWCAVRGQMTPEFLKIMDFSNRVHDSLKSPYKNPFNVDCKAIEMALDYLERDSSKCFS